MEISFEQRENEMILFLAGRLTSASVENINTGIKKMMEQYGIPLNLIIDMKQVVYINASALRAIYYLVRFMFHRGGMISFYGYEGITEQFIRLCGVSYPYPFHVLTTTLHKR